MRTGTPSRELPKVMIRLPHDMKRWVEKQAKRNGASQNSEIVRRLRADMDREIAAQVALKATTGFAA